MRRDRGGQGVKDKAMGKGRGFAADGSASTLVTDRTCVILFLINKDGF
jgi:hypothetical protein